MKFKILIFVLVAFLMTQPMVTYADTASAWLGQDELDAADRSSTDGTVNKHISSTNWGFASTSIKSGGKLYVQFGMIQFSPANGNYTNGYIYYEVRDNSYTGTLLTSGTVNRTTVVSNNLNFGLGYVYTHDTAAAGSEMMKPYKFYSSTVEAEGAAPTTPTGSATHSSGKVYKINVSSSANKTDTIWFGLRLNANNFAANNQGTTLGVYDDVTSYEYIVNTSSTAPTASYIDSYGSSSTSGSFTYTVASETIQYYVHIVAKSYTSKLSGVRTLALTPSVYKITLDANGGTLGDSISDNSVTNAFYERYGRWIGYYSSSGYKYWSTGSDGTTYLPFYATRTGYTFNGFYTTKSGGTKILSSNYVRVSNTYFTKDTTIYAQWSPWTHTVKYDVNGGSGAPDSQTKTYGVDLTLSSIKPTKTGYTFKYWSGSNGSNYNPGDTYTYEKNGGTVTLTAEWTDEKSPSCSISATPNEWSADNGVVTITAQDEGSGISTVTLKRYSYVTKLWSDVVSISDIDLIDVFNYEYIETNEGVYKYQVNVTDNAGNTTTVTSEIIYLDHSNPVMDGLEDIITEWTNELSIINISATDYLTETSFEGSGVKSVVITDENLIDRANGINEAIYVLSNDDEGVHTWTITVTDNVGHTVTETVPTRLDLTAPIIEGTESTYVTLLSGIVSGYCEDNIIDQHTDDDTSRSENSPNVTSGIKSVIVYKYIGKTGIVIYGDSVKKIFEESDTESYFDIYYEIPNTDRNVDYYLIIVKDFAGNTTRKQLVSQRRTLARIRTCIDRSSY